MVAARLDTVLTVKIVSTHFMTLDHGVLVTTHRGTSSRVIHHEELLALWMDTYYS